jgi:thiamine pyrophosphokinase
MKVHVNEFLHLSRVAQNYSYHLILLNSETLSIPQVKQLWNLCNMKICADGGANRLFNGIEESERSRFIPNFITGDLDSVKQDVADYYR